MGRLVQQRILECSICENTPEDGEFMWYMGSEVWCEACCDAAEKEPVEEDGEAK